MRVRLKADISVSDISVSDRKRLAAWLQQGKEYTVLEVDGPLLRIQDDTEGGNTHGLWPARYFDVSNAEVPRNWIIALDAEGRVCLAPRRWLEPGFWSAYYDDESAENLTWAQHRQRRDEAEAIFEEELKVIQA